MTTATTETKPAYSPGWPASSPAKRKFAGSIPTPGLMYRGYDIHEMAEKASFEEVAYLLLNGELPTEDQLAKFTGRSELNAQFPAPVTQMLRLMPAGHSSDGHVRTGNLDARAFDRELNDHSHDANIRKAIRLIAKDSTLITDGFRISQGEEPLPEKPELTLAANFFYKLNGEVPPNGKSG